MSTETPPPSFSGPAVVDNERLLEEQRLREEAMRRRSQRTATMSSTDSSARGETTGTSAPEGVIQKLERQNRELEARLAQLEGRDGRSSESSTASGIPEKKKNPWYKTWKLVPVLAVAIITYPVGTGILAAYTAYKLARWGIKKVSNSRQAKRDREEFNRETAGRPEGEIAELKRQLESATKENLRLSSRLEEEGIKDNPRAFAQAPTGMVNAASRASHEQRGEEQQALLAHDAMSRGSDSTSPHGANSRASTRDSQAPSGPAVAFVKLTRAHSSEAIPPAPTLSGGPRVLPHAVGSSVGGRNSSRRGK